MLVNKMIKINTTIIFSIVWIFFCAFFLIMAWQSFQSASTELPRYEYKASETATISIGSKNLPSVMEELANAHNAAVTELEDSIRNEAKTMTAINGISAILCLLWLFAQIADYKLNQKRK